MYFSEFNMKHFVMQIRVVNNKRQRDVFVFEFAHKLFSINEVSIDGSQTSHIIYVCSVLNELSIERRPIKGFG